MTAKNSKSRMTEFILTAQDCIQGMRGLPAESVDLVVTSPPYNIGMKYGLYEDRKNPREYAQWTMDWVSEVKRVLKPSGSFFLNVGAVPSSPFLPHEMAIRIASTFKLQNTFHWIKSVSIETPRGEILSVGHFKPINSERFVNNCHEFVFHFTKNGNVPLDRLSLGVPYVDKSNIKRWKRAKGRDVRCRGNVWFIPYETVDGRRKQRPHPAPFPVKLAVNCIKIHGCSEETIMLDPFLGMGQSALAASQCRVRKFIGFDIDPEYVEISKQRIFQNDPNQAARQ